MWKDLLGFTRVSESDILLQQRMSPEYKCLDYKYLIFA